MAGKILIIADDPLVAKSVSAFVKAAQIEPLVVGAAPEAQAVFNRERPNIVLCDLSLSGGGVVELIEHMRKIDDDVEIVALTVGQPERVVESTLLGASGYLTKPFTVEQFAKTLQAIMKRRPRRLALPSCPPGGTALAVSWTASGLAGVDALVAPTGLKVSTVAPPDGVWEALGEADPVLVVWCGSPQEKRTIEYLDRFRSVASTIPVVALCADQRGLDPTRLHETVLAVFPVPPPADAFARAVVSSQRLHFALNERLEALSRVDRLEAGLEHLRQVLQMEKGRRMTQVAKTEEISIRALHSLPAGVLVFDADIRVVEMNAAAERILRVNRREVIGRTLEEVPAMRGLERAVLKVIDTGQILSNLEAEIGAEENTRVLGFGCAPLMGDVGEAGVLVHFQDITAKKRLELHVRKTDRLASLGLMAGGVTAEIANPLGLAISYTDLLLRDPSDPNRVRSGLEKIKTALRRAGEVNSHIQRMVGQQSTAAKPCDLHEAITHVLGLLERKLELGSYEIHRALDAQVPIVMGDPVEFEQVFMNLFQYACEGSPGGGVIRVSTANLTGIVEVFIQDSGVGISPHLLSHIFDPFGAVDEDGKRSSLGLAICKNIVNRFGGVIRVDSELGKGTSFMIRLPLVPEEQRSKFVLPRMSSNPAAVKRKRAPVGIVAQEDLGIEIREWLVNGQLEATLYSDLETSLDRLRVDRPQIVVLDTASVGLGWMLYLQRLKTEELVRSVILIADEDEAAQGYSLEDAPPIKVVVRPAERDRLLQAVALVELESGPSTMSRGK